MTLPPRPDHAHQMKLGDCQYRDCYTLAQFKARELEIIEACKAVALSYSDKAAELFPTNGTVDAWLQDCAAAIDKLKEEL